VKYLRWEAFGPLVQATVVRY